MKNFLQGKLGYTLVLIASIILVVYITHFLQQRFKSASATFLDNTSAVNLQATVSQDQATVSKSNLLRGVSFQVAQNTPASSPTLLPTPSSIAQTPTPTPDPAPLIEEIKSLAARHATLHNSPQTDSVIAKYSDNPFGLTSKQIRDIYEEEYLAIKEADKPSQFEQLMNKLAPFGWGAFLLLVLWSAIQKKLTQIYEHLVNRAYNRLAGYRLLRRVALKKYRQALRDKSQHLFIPFRLNKPLDMDQGYIPLKVVGHNEKKLLDASQGVTNYKRLMVVGPPGSGKSTLLKYIALTYAKGQLILEPQPVPVLVNLHRLNNPDLSLKEQLVEELARNDFPHADQFVDHYLEAGRLILLLDGLDEVNSKQRQEVVQRINDFLHQYDNSRVIITCRTAVYKGEFDAIVTKRLEIVEFSDQQMRRFLGSWKQKMPAGKSLEQLLRNLHERPRIMQLARNPLLLTMITYLYTDMHFVLPHSRSEFYRKSTDLLLDQWHNEHNHFEVRDKQIILHRLALFNQEQAKSQQPDRHSIDYQDTLSQVRQLLPDINLESNQARPILDEIVERSGLLLSIDGGQRYQFAHLTLQEFFAAEALLGDTDTLLAHFKTDHDTWRETVKLWCGRAGDSTTLIRLIYAEDPILAFEALAEARRVDSNLVDQIIADFKTKLGNPDSSDLIERAFGAVAAKPRSLGETVFTFLAETLANTQEAAQRAAAANALSLTNLPKAAQILVTHYTEKPKVVRSALVRMGDLAVPPLVTLVEKETDKILRAQELKKVSKIAIKVWGLRALDDLVTIGTPQAAKSLVPLLWHNNLTFSICVAWRMAALLHLPGVEAVLRDYNLKPEWRKAEQLEWVWKPFKEPKNSVLPIITGRIAYLIAEAPKETIPDTTLELDPRLVIPLCVVKIDDETESLIGNKRRDIVWQADRIRRQGMGQAIDTNEFERKVKPFVKDTLRMHASLYWQYLVAGLSLTMQFDFLYRLVKGPKPKIDDWTNIFRPVEYKFETGWHFRTITIMFVIIFVASCYQFSIVALMSPAMLLSQELLIVFIAGLIYRLYVVFKGAPISFLLGMVGSSFGYATARGNSKKVALYKHLFTLSLLTDGSLFMIFYFASKFIFRIYNKYWFLVFVWTVFAGTVATLWRIGKQRDRESQNPLHGLLEPDETDDQDSTSQTVGKVPLF